MNKSVNLYLASGVCDSKAFWLVNFTEENDILNSYGSKLLECYRKELFGLEGAVEVKEAINTCLDILISDLNLEKYKLDNSCIGYSSEIPIDLIEDIFDLWAYNYHNKYSWKKYIGLLNFKKKIRKNNNYINIGLKGDIYDFSIKLDKLLSFTHNDLSLSQDKSYDLMW